MQNKNLEKFKLVAPIEKKVIHWITWKKLFWSVFIKSGSLFMLPRSKISLEICIWFFAMP